MSTRSVRGSPGSGWLSTCGFAKLTGIWFAGLLGLYGVYALITFFRMDPRLPGAYRAIMVLGPSTVASAVLVSAATFAGSAMRFDLLTTQDSERRRIYWGQLVLFGLAAYLLAAIGPPTVRSMLPRAASLISETNSLFPSVLGDLRLLSPVPLALFAVMSGVAGGVVGRATSRSVMTQAAAVPWLACLGLVGVFVASFLGTSNLIVEHGYPSVWIIVGPVTVPLIVISALAWREFPEHRSRLRVAQRQGEPVLLDSDTVDEILSKVIEHPHKTEGPKSATAASDEEEVVRLVRGIRHVAGSRARMSEAQVSALVAQLASQGEVGTPRGVHKRTVQHTPVLAFCSVSASLGAGCLVVGSMGGLVPSIFSAVVVGLVGSAVIFRSFGDRRNAYGT